MRGTAIVGTTGLAAPMSMLTICAPDNPCSIATTFGQERNMPIWVACVARAQVDRGSGRGDRREGSTESKQLRAS